jgi:glycosyltransferase involved in cell wall biosynthesis
VEQAFLSVQSKESCNVSLVSVIMPVYNAEKFVSQTVDCILAQTYRKFEFIIIDDGSTDRSLEILEKYARQDQRIRLVTRPNTGYVIALNEALELVRGPLIARIDADDLCSSQRFEVQVARMEEEPRLVALGSCASAIDEDGNMLGDYSVPLTHEAIEKNHLAGSSSIHHPAVMMRSWAVRKVGGYRPHYKPCEDFDLWLRLAEVGQVANLPEKLLTKRLFANSVVGSSLDVQEKIVRDILGETWQRRGLHGKLKLPTKRIRGRADLYRQWAWMALRRGQVPTSRRYAAKAFFMQPLKLESWRLAFCSLRGK